MHLRKALIQGFLNIFHIPLPMGHSVDTNEAIMASTPENTPCWHVSERPREICDLMGTCLEWAVEAMRPVSLLCFGTAGGCTFVADDQCGTIICRAAQSLVWCLQHAAPVSQILAWGWPTYWVATHNRFDFVVTVATLGVTLVVLYPNAYDDPRFIRLTSTVRLLRVFGLLFNLGEWWMIVSTFVRVLPAAAKLLCTSFLLMYTFSASGVYLFGGHINTDPKSAHFHALKVCAWPEHTRDRNARASCTHGPKCLCVPSSLCILSSCGTVPIWIRIVALCCVLLLLLLLLGCAGPWCAVPCCAGAGAVLCCVVLRCADAGALEAIGVLLSSLPIRGVIRLSQAKCKSQRYIHEAFQSDFVPGSDEAHQCKWVQCLVFGLMLSLVIARL